MPLVNNPLCQSLRLELPFWQAPLPFDIISPQMSAKISASGGHGILRVATHDSCASLEAKINDYRNYHQNPSFCFSHRLPQETSNAKPDPYLGEILQLRYGIGMLKPKQGDSFAQLLEVAIQAEPRVIGFAQGMPDSETIAYIQSKGIKTFVICSNMLELLAADDFGVDLFVLQGTEAGGERSNFSNKIEPITQPALSLLQQARTHTAKPLILWGDASDAADMVAAIISGAQGIMLDRPFLACAESGIDEKNRQRVISDNEFYSTLTYQYTARALRCLKHEFIHRPESLLSGNEALFAEAFLQAPHYRPLPISLSPIKDPQNLAHFIDSQSQRISQYIA